MSESDETVAPHEQDAPDTAAQPEIIEPEIIEVENASIITIEQEDEPPVREEAPPVEAEEAAPQPEEPAAEVPEVVEEAERPKTVRHRREPTRRAGTTTRRRPTGRSSDRPPTQRIGTRPHGRSNEEKAKLIVICATVGLLLVLIICAIGRAMKEPPPRRGTRVITIGDKLDRARSYKREGTSLMQKAFRSSGAEKNSLLAQAEGELRKSLAEYTSLIGMYKGPKYSYLHKEASDVQALIYTCLKSRTL